MVQFDYRRSIIEKLIKKIKEESFIKNKDIQTIDPIIKIGRQLYPFIPEKELNEYSCTALRIILKKSENSLYQTTL